MIRNNAAACSANSASEMPSATSTLTGASSPSSLLLRSEMRITSRIAPRLPPLALSQIAASISSRRALSTTRNFATASVSSRASSLSTAWRAPLSSR